MSDDSAKPTYNLVDEPWITVVYLDGTVKNVSLTALFQDAPSIRSIAGEMPQMQFAIVRLALAVLYRTYEFSDLGKQQLLEEWKDLWNQGAFDIEFVEGYLCTWHDGFNLLHENRPFYQVAGLEYVGKECDPIGELMPDIPKPEKFLFAMRSPQSVGELSLDEAARYLVLAQAYDIAGIKTPVRGNTHVNKGKVYAPKGAAGTGWCGAIGGVFLEGSNLFQTLMLNWVLWDDVRAKGAFGQCGEDLPPWELPSPGPDLREADPVGPVGMLTWQSRRIRIVFNDSRSRATGVVMCYGDVTTAIDKQDCETMTAWRESRAQQKRLGSTARIPWMPVQHSSGKALWRGLAPMLSVADGVAGEWADLRPGVVRWVQELLDARAIPLDRAFSIRAQGMVYGTQSSVFEESIDDKVDLCALMLRNDSAAVASVLEVVGQTEGAVNELVKFVKNMETAAGDKRRSDRFSEDVRERAYEALDRLFRDRIAHLTSEVDPFEYCGAWRGEVRSKLWGVARSYVEEAGHSMFMEHDGMTSGRALLFFRTGLARTLGNENVQPGVPDGFER